jgi:SAM-dependent methyltransferase
MSDTEGKTPAIYFPDVFEVTDLRHAQEIILTPEAGTTTAERWEKETPYLVGEIGRSLKLDGSACVVDYGCGVGRVAKGLIERFGCQVVGVDISVSMRQLAPGYVQSSDFAACAPEILDALVSRGFRATHAYACWVLQHCISPEDDLKRIDAALAPGGLLFVVNLHDRCIPTDQGWRSDGIDVETLLTERFEKLGAGRIPEGATSPEIANRSFTMTLRKRR